MGQAHRFHDEIVLGDLAFEATGDSVSELFAAAALAVIEAMVDPLTVGTNRTQKIRLSEAAIEDLLFEWLNAVVFVKDTEGVVFHDVRAAVSRDSEKNLWHLEAALIGDRVDATRQAFTNRRQGGDQTSVRGRTKRRHLVRPRRSGRVTGVQPPLPLVR